MGERNPKLDELDNSYKELSFINQKQEKRVRFLETRAINIVIFYCFFQAIILFGISHSSSNNALSNNWFTPFCLSLLIAIIAGLTFFSTITKWARTQCHYELTLLELETIYYQMIFVQNNHAQMQIIDKQQQQLRVLEPDMVKVYQRYAYLCVISFSLVAFTVVILSAIWSMPCHR